MSTAKNCVQVYARVKPLVSEHNTVKYVIESVQKKSSGENITFQVVPKNDPNFRRHYKFRFEKVLDTNVTQENIFDIVVKPVVDSVLDGYNGTVFAYGQTGSGKTYTITGSTEVYADRGIIPRTIQYIFRLIRNNPEVMYSIYVSYLEIYNEAGYDLLDQKASAVRLDDLQKVNMLEDALGNIHLKNLSLIPVTTETDALKILFYGDSNRTIAETAMNPFSSRSHCIFTIHVGIRKPNSKTIRRGKLHLVDLAGSERISKLPGTRITMNEARSINLTLHHLEQVILALSERKRQHVPYRNSILTSVLRDSLGGNCLTVMIATISIHFDNYSETLSTCRFAQRVALIHNQAAVNEDADPLEEILQLKQEVVNLKAQLTLSQAPTNTELTDIEKQQCHDAVTQYLTGATDTVKVEPNIQQFHFCFAILKEMLSKIQIQNNPTFKSEPTVDAIDSYQELIQQRDNEICVLMHLLRNEKNSKLPSEKSAPSLKVSPRELSETSDEWLTTISSVSSSRSSILNENEEDISVCQQLMEKKMEMARGVALEIATLKEQITAAMNSRKSSINLHKYQKLYKERVKTLRQLKDETDRIQQELNLKQQKFKSRNDGIRYYSHQVEFNENKSPDSVKVNDDESSKLKITDINMNLHSWKNDYSSDDEDSKSHDEKLIEENINKDTTEKDGFEVLYENKIAQCESESDLIDEKKHAAQQEDIKLGEFNEFIKKIPMTGDEEVDQEIINFYKEQFGIQ